MTRRDHTSGSRKRNGPNLTGNTCDAARLPATEANRANEVETWRVTDDWPAQVPVCREEVEILETFLGQLLDEILGGKHAAE